MIDQTSAVVGGNLAISLLERNIQLVPINGTLLSELTAAVGNNVKHTPATVEELPNLVKNSSEGQTVYNRTGAKTYNLSEHDALMDNYVPELATLITSHVSFARSVVYKKMSLFVEAVQSYHNTHGVKKAEDFFNVSFYKLPEIFRSQFLQDEFGLNTTTRNSPEVINFGETLNEEYDLLANLIVGESDTDEMLKMWFAEQSKDKLLGYLKNSISEYSLSLHERLNYNLINFLFYRNLVIKQNINNGMSLLQLVSKATVSRDYHIDQLRISMKIFDSKMKEGSIIGQESEVKFSYLADKQFNITLYSDSFDKAAEQGGTIDAVYGYIAQFGKCDLTLANLVARKDELETAWRNTRSLYAAYLLKNKEYIRIELKKIFMDVLNQDATEEEIAFQKANQDFAQQTVMLSNEYLDNLSVKELDQIQDVAFNLFAKIAYRHTAAQRIISDIMEIQSTNPNIETAEAAQGAVVNYIVDYLMEQCNITA